MATQLTNREKLAFQLDHLSDAEIEEITAYVSTMEARRCDTRQPETVDDELIATLSAAYENRRAQQAFEWDAVRQHSEMKAIKVRVAHR